MSDFLLDVRLTLRRLAKQPAFTTMIVLILALGIGLNTVIFSIAYGVLLRPLSYPEPEALVQLWPGTYVNKLIAESVAERSTALESVSAYTGQFFPVTSDGDPSIIKGARVGSRHFEMLRATPLLGRTFSADEQQPGKDRVVVISHGLWRRRYGADPKIIGRSMVIDGQPHTIISVMPEGFQPLERDWEMWLPLVIDRTNEKDLLGSFYLTLVGRLQRGASPKQAEGEIRALLASLKVEYPHLITAEIVAAAKVVSLHDHLVSNVRPTLLVLVGSVAFVLLISCANVANLLLTRAIRRRREVAIRTAVGASHARLIREVLTESVLLAVMGGIAGLLLTFYGLQLLASQLPADMPRVSEIHLDGPVLAFNLGVSLITGLIFGVWPALRTLRIDHQAELKEGSGGSAGRESRRSSRLLVAAQVATVSVLLVGAGLLLRSLWRLQAVDPGFQPKALLSFRLDVPSSYYPENPQLVEYYRRVLEQVRAVPGVAAAGAIHLLPLSSDNWNFPYMAEGFVFPSGGQTVTLPDANFRVVSPEYFRAAGVKLFEGRFLSESDHADAPPVGLINRTMAAQLWPGRSAVGRTIQLFGDGGPVFTVIGVVEDVHQERLDAPPRPEMYRPYAQWPVGSMYVLVRSTLAPGTLVPTLRSAVWKVDPSIPISELRSGEEMVRASVTDERMTSFVIVTFAALALILALVGIYGVISYSVEQRSHEIAIRMALGAQRQHIFQQVVGEGLGITVVGLVFGLAAALACTRILVGRLYQTPAGDVPTYLAVAVLMAVAALASSGFPAWRATQVDQVSALKQE